MSIKNELANLDTSVSLKEDIKTSWFHKTINQLLKTFNKPSLMENKNNLPQINSANNINLDDKVDDFINWYKEKIVRGHYTDIGEYHEPIHMRNFIEKMAVWFELVYPESEIHRIFDDPYNKENYVNKAMFKDNPYVKELLGSDSDISYLDWSDFYNFTSFFNSLPSDEQEYLRLPHYPGIVYYDSYAHMHLTKDGFIMEAEDIPFVESKIDASNEYHITDLWQYMQSMKIKPPEKCEIETVISRHLDEMQQINSMLDCIMYRIIERGSNRIGPKRAFLFAQAFGRDISIPMIYGVDTSDPGLRRFINAYFKAGGSKDITCLVNYFSKSSKNEKVDTISMRELLKTTPDNCIDFYTEEEKGDMARLLGILNYVSKEKEKKEKHLKYLKIVNK